MPTVYDIGNYDLAGYCVGIVEMGHELPKFDLYEEGDLLISLPSTGLHCAGFSAILSCLKNMGIDLIQRVEFTGEKKSLGKVLAAPSRVYVKEVLQLIRTNVVKSVAHITSGLIPDVARIIPADYEITLDFGDLKVPEMYAWLATKCKLDPQSLLQHLNCGIGLVLVVQKNNKTWRSMLTGAKVFGVIKKKIPNFSQKTQILVKNFNEALLKHEQKYGLPGNGELHESHHRNLQESLVMSAEQRSESYLAQNRRRLTVIPESFNDPILIMGTDGVGTKIKIAQQTGRNSTVGIDLVAMCVNDILCNGAEPYTFLSYYACGLVETDKATDIMNGVAEGSRQAGSSLIGIFYTDTFLIDYGL